MDIALQNDLKEAAALLATSARPSVFSGAGMSQESGIDTYRGDGGLWNKQDVDEVATAFAFHQRPHSVLDFLEKVRQQVRNAQPHRGHTALAIIEQQYLSGLPVITQNVDDLHERAGSRHVVHLHGQITQNRCSRYCRGMPSMLASDELTLPNGETIVRCIYCGQYARPDVILFGEYLHGYVMDQARYIAENTDLMLVIGTSGLVAPASKLPLTAQDNGATLIEINPESTRMTPNVDIFIPMKAGEALAHILHILNGIFTDPSTPSLDNGSSGDSQ